MPRKTKKTIAPKRLTAKPSKKAPGLDLAQFESAWAAQQSRIKDLAQEQASADIALVEAHRVLEAAKVAFQKAQERKTVAERKLATLRANLGGE